MDPIRPIAQNVFLQIMDDYFNHLQLAVKANKEWHLMPNDLKKKLRIEAIKKIRLPEIDFYPHFSEVLLAIPPKKSDSYDLYYQAERKITNYQKFFKGDYIDWYTNIYLKTVSKFNQFLKKNNDAKNLGPFGKVFAGEQRGFPEENTAKETEIVFGINDYIQGHPGTKLSANTEIVKDLLVKNQYDDVFIKPDVQFIFRGMKLDPTQFNEFKTKLNLITNPEQKSYLIKPKKPLYFKPISGRNFSSWSSNKKIASDFSKFMGEYGEFTDKKISIVITAKVKQNDPNQFFDLKNWYSELDHNSFSKEEEILTFGNVLVDKIEIYFNN